MNWKSLLTETISVAIAAAIGTTLGCCFGSKLKQVKKPRKEKYSEIK